MSAINELVDAIISGEYDDYEGEILAAFNQRKRIRRDERVLTLRQVMRVGDVCTITGSQKYLEGARVKLLEIPGRGKYTRCEMLETRMGTKKVFRAGLDIRIPTVCLVPVKELEV